MTGGSDDGRQHHQSEQHVHQGFDDALQVGLRRAALTVRGITDLRIVEQSARVKNGTITEYCVGIEITFVLED